METVSWVDELIVQRRYDDAMSMEAASGAWFTCWRLLVGLCSENGQDDLVQVLIQWCRCHTERRTY